VNIANVLLAVGVARQHELGIRAALGATRARAVRQLVCETLMLMLGGGVAGLLVARIIIALIKWLVPPI
jgi:putative ABC transport system permease protein